MITSKQGPLVQAEWRQRLINGSYMVRASGIFQLDKQAFLDKGDLPGYRDFRGHVESSGQFRLNNKWVYGWDGTLVTDRSYFQDYGLLTEGPDGQSARDDAGLRDVAGLPAGPRREQLLRYPRDVLLWLFQPGQPAPDPGHSSGHRSRLYVAKHPVLGGELSLHSNLTSLTREAAFFDPITLNAVNQRLVLDRQRRSGRQDVNNCLLRGVPGTYTRFSTEVNWRRTVIDTYGQMFTPFASARVDFANVEIVNDPGVSNFMKPGETDVARVMPTVGLEYRYPFISVQSWGTQTIEPIAQVIARPNETGIGQAAQRGLAEPDLRRQQPVRVNKFAGYDRVEGGGRLNAGINYTAQFNRGGFVNVMFGQSYQPVRAELLCGRRPDQYRHPERPRHHPLRLCGAGGLPAEFDVHADLTVPHERGRLHAAADANSRRRPISTAGPPR